MNDVRTLDERAHSASNALRAAAGRRPEPAEPPHVPRRHTTWLAVAAVITAIALAAGVLVARGDKRASVTHPSNVVQWPATLATDRPLIEAGHRVWVVGENAVQLVGRTPSERPSTFPVPWTITGATVDGDTLYVTGGTPGRVAAFSPTGPSGSWTLPYANPRNIAVAGTAIFVSDTYDPGLWQVNRMTGQMHRLELPRTPDFGITAPSRGAPVSTAAGNAIAQLAGVDGRLLVVATAVQRQQQWSYINELEFYDAWRPSWYSSNVPFRIVRDGASLWTVSGSNPVYWDRRSDGLHQYWTTSGSTYILPFRITDTEAAAARPALFVRHGNKIARIDRRTARLDEFHAPVSTLAAWTVEDNGRLWFTDGRGSLVSMDDPGASGHGRDVCASRQQDGSCLG